MRTLSPSLFLALSLGAIAVGLPTLAEAQVAIADFTGARASRVRGQVFTRLRQADIEVVALSDSEGSDPAAVAAQTGASAVVIATIRRRGGQWQGTAQIFDAQGSPIGEVEASSRASGGFAAELSRELVSALQALPAPRAAAAAAPTRSGGTRRVVVGELSGRGAARIRNQLVRAVVGMDGVEVVPQDEMDDAATRLGVSVADAAGFQAIAAELDLAALVEGEVTRRGRRWTANVLVRDGVSGGAIGEAEFLGRSAGSLATAVRRGSEELEPLIAQTSAPAPEEPEVTEVEDGGQVASSGSSPGTRAPGSRAAPAYMTRSSDEFPTAIELTILGKIFSRDFTYNDDIHERLRAYNLDAGPAIAFQMRWYPGAHFTSGFASMIGLDLSYERAFGIDSVRGLRDGDSYKYPTNAQAFFFGLRGRYLLGDQEFSAVVGYGGHSFTVEPGEAVPGRSNIPEIPRARYRFLRLGLEARLAPVGGLRVTARAAYLPILDAGGVESAEWFPRADISGAEVEGLIGYELDVGLEIWVGVELRRYWYDMHPEPLDPWIAGGAVDQYVGYELGLTWRR